ncbi:putative alkaline phosphatase [Melioribacter roseus P3M-2]|uniref:Putative alkaline phosphatase n=1 Tax=Melioribacter roseus (strain DSM 23840 / JCM 17771 / VKM B-2668 / P3M-2) TaxID=1191523 RepID=I6ZXW3_MELRP|nr:alkaline phosphatase family protein [Melioribacter roseus]AFN73883.1 putative alkaline phosphatase [Melioribacter roseus P3M-2]
MTKNIIRLLILILLLILPQTYGYGKDEAPVKVKLVVQIVVDQLRADQIDKYSANLSEEGFNYLKKNGRYFGNTKISYARSATGPGHASIATGSVPAYHGIVNNDWYDRISKKKVYCAEYGGVISPLNLIGSTLSDEIYISQAGNAKIFGVSQKDRGAVFLAGHFGKAFWMDDDSIKFITSAYYYDKAPDFLNKFNDEIKFDNFSGYSWKPLYDPEKYVNYADKRQTEKFGLARFEKQSEPSAILNSPLGDSLTFELAKFIIMENRLGKGGHTDYISISFSSTDKIGHYFGNSSIEFEDQIYRLDKLIAGLIDFLDKYAGMNNVLITLTADHGAKDSFVPSNGNKNSTPERRRSGNLKSLCNDYVKDKLNVDFDAVEEIIMPNIYLNEDAIKNNGLKVEDVEILLKEYLRNKNGIYDVYTSSEIERNNLLLNMISSRVINSYCHKRSGNLYIVFEPEIPGGGNFYNRSEHGTPWNYDISIPLFFCGPGIVSGGYDGEVYIEDIAVTLANYLGLKLPSAASGKVIKFAR